MDPCTRVHNTNCILIGSAVFAGLTIVTDRQTDRQTDRPVATPSVTIGRIDVRIYNATAMRPIIKRNAEIFKAHPVLRSCEKWFFTITIGRSLSLHMFLTVWIQTSCGCMFCANTIAQQHVVDVSDNWSSLCLIYGRRSKTPCSCTTNRRSATEVRFIGCFLASSLSA